MTNVRITTLVALLFTFAFLNSACLPTSLTDAIENAVKNNSSGNDNGGGGNNDNGNGGDGGPIGTVDTGSPDNLITKYSFENESYLIYNQDRTEDPGDSTEVFSLGLRQTHTEIPDYFLDYTRIKYQNSTSPTYFLHLADVRWKESGDLIVSSGGSGGVISLTSSGELRVRGPNFEETPTGTFTYKGLNILRYTGAEFSGTPDGSDGYDMNIDFQNGIFTLLVDFETGKGTINGNAMQIHYDPVGASSTIAGEINVNNKTGEFNTPDGKFLVVTLNEPEGVSMPKTAGKRIINAKIVGQFGGLPRDEDTGMLETDGNHGVRGIYYDTENEQPLIYGAIVGSRQ